MWKRSDEKSSHQDDKAIIELEAEMPRAQYYFNLDFDELSCLPTHFGLEFLKPA
jgi:hypothetical protein